MKQSPHTPAKSSTEPAELDALYEASPEKFVAERNALVQKLRQQGANDQAKAIASLSKPTLVTWATNQVARREREKVQELLEAADRVRLAQTRALSGGSPGAQELRDASREQRTLISELMRSASAILEDAGHQPSASVLGRIETTLQSAALSTGPERELLANGRLSGEVQQFGFPAQEVLASEARRIQAEQPKRASPEANRREAEARRRQVTERKGALDNAKKEAARLALEAKKAEAQAAKLAERAERARQVASDETGAAASALQAAAEAKEKAAAAATRLRQAEAELEAVQGQS
jgi:hypothetical protein